MLKRELRRLLFWILFAILILGFGISFGFVGIEIGKPNNISGSWGIPMAILGVIFACALGVALNEIKFFNPRD